ncbi:hypothetical protein CANMA_003613 [Candida margitis]|uniref:uncharacterized protein n=1 Tax=Candida margitis TaxID=1775924 RepID=UPI002227A4EC|nr:uncharacterized protein CANMA_003613 [Candida margitis]KAI5962838.1 hypothetical protein CANMA_003613 [Candida margitis]
MKYLIALLGLSSSIVHALEFYHFDKSRLSADSILEQFDYPSLSNSPWKVTRAKKYDEGRDEIVKYAGEWAIEPPFIYPAFEDDFGLVMKSRASHYSIAYKLPHTIENIDKDLVVQYEVKLQKGLECGGAYIKLLDKSTNYHFFNSETPYQIMFGPDKCGSENKIYFILRKSLPNGTIEEKQLRFPPLARINDLTNLYTLIIRKNNDFEIRINGKVVESGNLITDENLFSPTMNPPKMIDDPDDTKPADWDDREHIPDPNVEPPKDYEKLHAHHIIPDPNAVKPDDWDELAPRYIPDPDAIRPLDAPNDWQPPLIVNPKCETGCGKWTPPMIANDDYLGPWFPPDIVNPNYQGTWKPRRIFNPDYYEMENPGQLDKPVGGLGFELWNMDGGVLFDNIYLGNSIAEAELIGNETFSVKQKLEYEYKKKNPQKAPNEPVSPPPNFDDILNDADVSNLRQFVIFIKLLTRKEYLDFSDFIFELLLDPVTTIISHPIRTVIYCFIVLFVVSVVGGIASVLTFVVFSNRSAELEVNENRHRSDDGDDIVVINRAIEKVEDAEDDDQTLRQR